eukprot:COSAG05_NODE_6992_length_869_cov_29.166234_2_plen_37_part_01
MRAIEKIVFVYPCECQEKDAQHSVRVLWPFIYGFFRL